MQTFVEVTAPQRSPAVTISKFACFISRHWMIFFSLLFGLYVALPFLAPVFMEIGLSSLAQVIYSIYAYFCHQLPERSFFLFGPRIMVPLSEIQANWPGNSDPMILRKFIGNTEMGWKVAWSDRMVYMYTSVLIFAWVWRIIRRKVPRISLIILSLFLLPMAIDGTTHMISDLFGLHQGFRYNNAWLAVITQNAFSQSFYSGDTWSSFNAIMRMVTGILFGVGIVWYGFPYLEAYFNDLSDYINQKFEQKHLRL